MADDSNNSVHGLIMLMIVVGVAMVGFVILMARDNDLSKKNSDHLHEFSNSGNGSAIQDDYNTDSLKASKKHQTTFAPAVMGAAKPVQDDEVQAEATTVPTTNPMTGPMNGADTQPASEP